MYAAISDLSLAYDNRTLIELTNPDDPTATSYNSDRLNYALDRATAEIDGYLGKCYKLPLETVPPVIKYKAITLARYYLESHCTNAERVQRDYDEAIAWLKDVCCGDCSLGLEIEEKSTGAIGYITQPKVFTREGLTEDWYSQGGWRY